MIKRLSCSLPLFGAALGMAALGVIVLLGAEQALEMGCLVMRSDWDGA